MLMFSIQTTVTHIRGRDQCSSCGRLLTIARGCWSEDSRVIQGAQQSVLEYKTVWDKVPLPTMAAFLV